MLFIRRLALGRLLLKMSSAMLSPLFSRSLAAPSRNIAMSNRLAGDLQSSWSLQLAKQKSGGWTANARTRIGPQRKSIATESASKLAKLQDSMKASPMHWWLFGTAGLVATTLTVGAAARLTRTGVSTLYWKPHSVMSPSNDRDCMKEFDVYREFCHLHQRRPMSFEDFKRNYKWERAHRLLGQSSMLAFLGPLGYFAAKKMIPVWMQAPLVLVTGLGATQMFVGWRMVRHNLEEDEATHHRKGNYLATFGFPIHEILSLGNFSLLVWTGLSLMSPTTRAVKLRELTMTSALKDIGQVRQYMHWLTGLLAGTIVAGTLVAEIDGGKEFNTFPKMGDHWVPKGLFELSPWTRNLYDNVAQVQLHHRILAVSTFAAYTAVYMKARKPNVWTNLPHDSQLAFNATMAAVGGQIVMGVTMLVNSVPTTLALVHQSGAVLILGTSLWALHSLRFARPGGVVGMAKLATKVL